MTPNLQNLHSKMFRCLRKLLKCQNAWNTRKCVNFCTFLKSKNMQTGAHSIGTRVKTLVETKICGFQSGNKYIWRDNIDNVLPPVAGIDMHRRQRISVLLAVTTAFYFWEIHWKMVIAVKHAWQKLPANFCTKLMVKPSIRDSRPWRRCYGSALTKPILPWNRSEVEKGK